MNCTPAALRKRLTGKVPCQIAQVRSRLPSSSPQRASPAGTAARFDSLGAPAIRACRAAEDCRTLWHGGDHSLPPPDAVSRCRLLEEHTVRSAERRPLSESVRVIRGFGSGVNGCSPIDMCAGEGIGGDSATREPCRWRNVHRLRLDSVCSRSYGRRLRQCLSTRGGYIAWNVG